MEQKDKELYYKLITDCESLIECPNKKAGKRVLACEYCRFEYLRKAIAKEIYGEINSCIEQGQEYCGLDWRGLLTAKNVILVYCKKKGVEVE